MTFTMLFPVMLVAAGLFGLWHINYLKKKHPKYWTPDVGDKDESSSTHTKEI